MMALDGHVRVSDILIFTLQTEGATAGPVRFGIPIHDVVEVTTACAITALPGSVDDLGFDHQSPIFEGIVDYHGELAAVINLRTRFGQPVRKLTPSEHFIFIRLSDVHNNLAALRVDRVEQLASAPASEDISLMSELNQLTKRAQRANSEMAARHGAHEGELASGIAKLSDGLVYIFDLKTLLTSAEAELLGRILEEARLTRRSDGV